MDISIIIPLYNEEESIKELFNWIKSVLTRQNLSYEVIFIDDGSTDSSWDVIEKLASSEKAVKGFSFRRNYGKSAALHIGFAQATGNVVITMDGDLQDSPEEIPELYKMIMAHGFDLVSGWKKKRHDPISKTIPSKFFNWTARIVSGIKLHDFNCGLKAYRNKVIKNIEVYGEMHRYIPLLAKQAGFTKIGEKVVQHQARKYGVSKFGLERFFKGFLDLMSLTFISKFGKRPMHLFGTLGTLMFFAGGIVSVWIVGSKIYQQFNNLPWRDATEQPLFYIALMSAIIGVQLFLTGFVAELVSRTSPERNNYQIDKDVVGRQGPPQAKSRPPHKGPKRPQSAEKPEIKKTINKPVHRAKTSPEKPAETGQIQVKPQQQKPDQDKRTQRRPNRPQKRNTNTKPRNPENQAPKPE